jgi:hypothetical protein
MHLGPPKEPRDRQARGPAKTPSFEIAELAGRRLSHERSEWGSSEWLASHMPQNPCLGGLSRELPEAYECLLLSIL